MSTNQTIALNRFSEEDIYLFKEGKHSQLYRIFGAHPMEHDGKKGVYFAVWAPSAEKVQVIGDFNAWNGDQFELFVRWDQSGIWEGFIPGLKIGQLYKYKIFSHHHGQILEKADPFARRAEHPPKTASIIDDTNSKIHSPKWIQKRAEINRLDRAISIYEVHLASCWRNLEENRPLSYKELATTLVNHVKKAGFTHVEFMPIMEYPFDPSWGYQITGYFAPTSRMGTPEDFGMLVDAFHDTGIGVILDWVPSHFPNDAHGLGNFDGSHLYEHPDPRKGYHPDWKSLIFNYERPEVRSFLLSNANFWLSEFNVDGLRVDAVASMLYLDYSRNEGEWEPNEFGGRENLAAIQFLQQLNERMYAEHPHIQMIAEESTAFPGVTKPVEYGGLGFGLKWMMGWMHDTLEYFKKDTIYRKYHHNEITFSLTYAFSEQYVLPFSHDEVVHGKGSLMERMPGDEWQRFANLRTLYGYMFAHPGAKMLFMGQEIGQYEEWNFQGSVYWDLLQYDFHAGVFQLIQDVNHIFKTEAAFHEQNYSPDGFEWVNYGDHERSTIAFVRKGINEKILVICNFVPAVHSDYPLPEGTYEVIFNSDSKRYAGSDAGPKVGQVCENKLEVPPLGVLYLKMKG